METIVTQPCGLCTEENRLMRRATDGASAKGGVDHKRLHSPGIHGLLSRVDDGPGLRQLLKDPDASFPGPDRALKNGNTCTVWATEVDNRQVVVKRYNVKNFWHGLKLSTRAGRAFRSWDNALCLLDHGVVTPRPVAVVKMRKGLLKPVSYLLMEKVEGVGAQLWFRDPAVGPGAREQMALRVVTLLRRLETLRVSHGDLKATNVLIVGETPVLIDLDAMNWHQVQARFERARRADMQRFLHNWDDVPELQRWYLERLT